MTKEEFVKKSICIHGDRYDYSKVEYINNKTNVCIICPIHGEFWQTPKNHLKGCNCPKCSKTHHYTTEEWIKEARKVHGDKYDYSKTVYEQNKKRVCIICPIHGEFWQSPNNHLRGEGCIKCRNDKMSEDRKLSKDQFVERCRKVHGDKYDYSKSVYVNNSNKLIIICPKHGEFLKTPANHLKGQGCPTCRMEELKKKSEAKRIKITDPKESNFQRHPYRETALIKIQEKYGNKYVLSESDIVNSKSKIKIICPEHGPFYKNISKFISGQECELCKAQRKNEEALRKGKDNFIRVSRSIHGDKYDYSKVNYRGGNIKVEIICPIHGEFLQTPGSHKKGCGCPICAQEIRTKKQTKTTEKFVTELKELYGDKYDYSEVEYIDNTTPVKIICHKKKKNGKEHGAFFVNPNKALTRGCNCPSCLHSVSYPEKELYEYICSIIGSENVVRNERKVLKGYEIDIYAPSLRIGFEFNGLFWHSEQISHINKNTHINKTKECEKNGIRLIQIFSDEYFQNKEVVKTKIKHILGKCDNLPKIMGRKCDIKEIKMEEAKNFLKRNHIQGFAGASVYLGAFFEGNLIGVMTFKRENKNGMWELNRFATDYDYICSGVGGKIFNYFVKNFNPKEVKSFADRRWSSILGKNLYTTLGFTLDKVIPPDYRYVDSRKPSNGRIHKFNFRKQVLHKKYGLPLTLTEREMSKQIGFYRIYDCGLLKYIWKNEKK